MGNRNVVLRNLGWGLIIFLVVLLTSAAIFGCRSSGGVYVPDWGKLDTVGDEVLAYIELEKSNRADDPKTLERLTEIGETAAKLDAALHQAATTGTAPAELDDYLLIATGSLDEWIRSLPPGDDLRQSLTSARALLSVIKVALV